MIFKNMIKVILIESLNICYIINTDNTDDADDTEGGKT